MPINHYNLIFYRGISSENFEASSLNRKIIFSVIKFSKYSG